MRRAFTLIELLVVISIISLLMGILLPALSNARERANQIACADIEKQLLYAMHIYATENRNFLPFCNSEGLVAKASAPEHDFAHLPGWLYMPQSNGDPNYKATSDVTDQVLTGSLWYYLGTKKAYRCPTDRVAPGAPYFSAQLGASGWTTKDLTSYTMNGAINAYAHKSGNGTAGDETYPIYPAQRLDFMRPDGLCVWEVNEQGILADGSTESPDLLYNDGNNRPEEGITRRHIRGASIGQFDGRVTWWNFDAYAREELLGPGRLWCDITAADGGLTSWKGGGGGG